VLGYYLVGCSVALFVKGVIVHQRLISLKRDQCDARIMSQWLVAVQQSAARQGDEEFFIVQLAMPGAPKGGGEKREQMAASTDKQQPSDTEACDGDMLKFNCRKCKKEFHLHRKFSGKKGRCKKCGELNVVGASQPT
jgi:hypothetical protein